MKYVTIWFFKFPLLFVTKFLWFFHTIVTIPVMLRTLWTDPNPRMFPIWKSREHMTYSLDIVNSPSLANSSLYFSRTLCKLLWIRFFTELGNPPVWPIILIACKSPQISSRLSFFTRLVQIESNSLGMENLVCIWNKIILLEKYFWNSGKSTHFWIINLHEIGDNWIIQGHPFIL